MKKYQDIFWLFLILGIPTVWFFTVGRSDSTTIAIDEISSLKKNYAFVGYETLNVRESPSTDASIVTQLSKGDYITYYIIDSVEAWYSFEEDTLKGWVYADGLSAKDPLERDKYLKYSRAQVAAFNSIVEPMLKQNLLLIKPQLSQAYIDPVMWGISDVEQKTTILQAIMMYSDFNYKSGVSYFEFFSKQSGRKIAKYGLSGFSFY